MTLHDAARQIAAAPGDLSAWSKALPGSECRVSAGLTRSLRRLGWPHRRVTLPHQRAAGHKEVDQDVLVFPVAMVAELCRLMGWQFDATAEVLD